MSLLSENLYVSSRLILPGTWESQYKEKCKSKGDTRGAVNSEAEGEKRLEHATRSF